MSVSDSMKGDRKVPSASIGRAGGYDESAVVLNVQRMSTEDGPGLRTTVFFKGCSLACDWCQNPESMEFRPEMTFHPVRCMECGSCVDACPHGLLGKSNEGGRAPADGACRTCASCARECPTRARERVGERWSLSSLLKEVEKDRAYFSTGGGGVTASGGEPMMQADFVATFFERCRATGLHTALDTSGQCKNEDLRLVLRETDHVLYDLKEACPERHARFTGHDNSRILENLLVVREALAEDGGPSALWIRTPLIPGATATPENLRALGRRIEDHLSGMVMRWELCAFNELCAEKYERDGREFAYSGVRRLRDEEHQRLLDAARSSGVDPDIVHLTGGM